VGIFAAARDITDRKRTEEDLIRSNKDLQQFAYVASHDLQEPLRNVASSLQMLKKKYNNKLDAEADQYIYYAVEGATRMKSLIQDLLAYSRVGTRGKRPESADCEQVLARTLNNLKPAISESGAIITHDQLPAVLADDTQLLQVFQNLIGNAIKFRRDEPPQIHVSAVKNKDDWIFSIKDNGIGIESHHLERIFVIFQRLHKRSQYEGTGMGLAIVKKVIERHGGRVWVESEPGVGTTFYFTLPERG
jgi:light-regulated signal transduction histidine kinase (bacteriophytochrome)